MVKRQKEEKKENSLIRNFLIKVLISLLLFLSFLIGIKKDKNFKNIIYEHIYNNNISFAKLSTMYNNAFGSIFPIKTPTDEIVMVFDDKLNYKSINTYKNGFILNLNNNLVPNIVNGMIVFIGNKDDYGKTVIVETEDKTQIWYSNLDITNLMIYDYIKKGDIVGEARDNKLIMVFQKDGEYLDYKEFI